MATLIDELSFEEFFGSPLPNVNDEDRRLDKIFELLNEAEKIKDENFRAVYLYNEWSKCRVEYYISVI